ncbi:ABC transporter ATP-binding protein [Actinomadura rubrisoli]|uniref:ABC transporter ATP-binding protein n=1 Tax=Actinomadura rubrisoli TaxID=2530368 RepID=A0A4R5CBT8_9ACTN|nr:ABC transporter ATP-binding protein [Actinomadura rubrisoli]TDD96329.1 ABC transporter ATP-binding protein [Actinomadura rubrisoli]
MTGDDRAAAVRDLRVEVSADHDIVDEITLALRPGEIVGLVGESGSGKTTVGMALLGYARRGARIAGGSVEVAGTDLLPLGDQGRRALRGRTVAYVPQDPAAALNPALSVARQLGEVIEAHEPGTSRAETRSRIRAVLEEVGLPSEAAFQARYPHQLSGGQQQRVGIAMAVILTPAVLVLDEPTTGLDVTTQTRVLAMVRRLCDAHSIAALYVTHDLSLVADIADRVLVMYAGRIVESGPVREVFADPAHPYTQALLGSVPDVRARTVLATIPGTTAPPGRRPGGCSFHPRCPIAVDACASGEPPAAVPVGGREVRCTRVRERRRVVARIVQEIPPPPDGPAVLRVTDLRAGYRHRQVLFDVSFELRAAECLAVVGESGSGKSTLSRCLIGLHPEHRGEVLLHGTPLASRARSRPAGTRRMMQYIFQSPFNSLNPRRTVGEILAVVHRMFHRDDRAAVTAAVERALERVGLTGATMTRYPDELSGGERQRVSIARALVCRPEVLICDEVTSALDVSVQAAILELLRGLQRDEGLAMLFVTHDLAVVRNTADRVLVLKDGRVVELDTVTNVLDHPAHPYTQELVKGTRSIEPV